MPNAGRKYCIKCNESKWVSSYVLDPNICRPCMRKVLPNNQFKKTRRECLRCSKLKELPSNNRICNDCKKSNEFIELSDVTEFTCEFWTVITGKNFRVNERSRRGRAPKKKAEFTRITLLKYLSLQVSICRFTLNYS